MVVAVASPSSAAPSAGRPHPPYKEMILQALTELRDPSGSSRRAIASYIADHFTGLHARHDALLSVHLRRLSSHGQLRLVSGNYFVSTATQQLGPGQKRGRGRPRKNADLAPSASASVFQGPKRGRGRPRKNALDLVASSASPLQGAGAPPPPSGVKRGRGRPRKNALVPAPSSSSPLLGAIAPPPPSGVKRRRGRPRKNALVPVSSSPSPLLGAIAPPPPSGVKRGCGRPRKNALAVVPVSSSSSPLLGATAPWPPSGVKWGRGRPRKNAQGPGGLPQRYTTTRLSPLPVTMSRSGKSMSGRPKVAIDISTLRGSSTRISVGSNSMVGAKRGRGRPLKVAAAGKKKRGRPPKEKMQTESVQSVYASLTKRGPGRPRKDKALDSGHLKASQMTEGQDEALTVQAADQTGAVQNEVEPRSLQACGTLTEKRGRGRPRKRPLETEAAEAGFPAFGEKRGPGRPRKEKTLPTEHLKAAHLTEGRHEALPAQAGNQAGAVQNELEARSLQSCGTLTVKRGRGRPRKKPLETETAETKVAALMKKRGRGRPRKERPSAGRSAGSRDTELMGIKRGPGRPRKALPLEAGSVETTVEVPRDLTEERPEKVGDLVSGKNAEAQGVLLVEGIDNGSVDAECVAEEEVAIAPMDAGGVQLSGEEAAIAPMDAGGATPKVDPSDSNVGTESH